MLRTVHLALAMALAAALCQFRPVQAADAYIIDPSHTSVVFSVGHAGLSYTYGFFRKASGSYILDANPANCRFQFSIETASLDTNHAKRDDHLRGPDVFNAPQHPNITFESSSCKLAKTPDQSVVYEVTGSLTMHGISRQITVPLRLLAERNGPYGDPRTGFLCQTALKRSDYDMTNLLEDDLVGDAVTITISFEGVKQERGAAGQRER